MEFDPFVIWEVVGQMWTFIEVPGFERFGAQHTKLRDGAERKQQGYFVTRKTRYRELTGSIPVYYPIDRL
jgi:hypothetical protein